MVRVSDRCFEPVHVVSVIVSVSSTTFWLRILDFSRARPGVMEEDSSSLPRCFSTPG